MALTIRRFVLVAAAVALVSGDALAQTPAERAEIENARAKELFARGEFKFALELYEKSYSINPLPKYLCNMAQSRLKLAESSSDAARKRELLVKARANVEYCQAKTMTDDKMAPAAKERQTKWARRHRTKILEELKKLDEVKKEPVVSTKPAPEPAGKPEPVEVPASKPAATPASVAVPTSTETTAEASTPIYKKWWLWTIVGAVVVGGVTTAAVFGSRGDSREPVSNGVDY